jgi:MFS family permease
VTAPQTGPESCEIAIEPPARGWLTRGIASIGAASFWGHEIATSLLPSLVTHTLRSSAGALGLIEGMSDALTGIAKLFGGSLANDPERRVRMASGGYIVTAAATSAIGAVTAVWQVGLLRAVAWSARGVRSPARDAMLASLATPETYGRAYGLERAGDNLGAVVGPLTAAGLVSAIGIRSSIYLAAIPGAFAAVAIVAAAREARARRPAARQERRIHLELSALRRAGVVRPLLPIAMFELGNCATTLLILRATDLLHHGGRSVTAAASLAILMYAGHNLLGTIFAFAGGHWIDRASPRSRSPPAPPSSPLRTVSSPWEPIRPPSSSSPSCWPGAVSASRRRPSRPPSPGFFPTICAEAASACSAAFSRSETSPRRRSSAPSGAPSHLRLGSSTPPAG